MADGDAAAPDRTAVDGLVELLDLERIEHDIFRGVSPKERSQRVFGGQVAGQALVAAGRTVDPDRLVHSLHSYFIRPGDPTIPIVYEVDRVRDGRSFTTRRVIAVQNGQADLLAVGVLPARAGRHRPPVRRCPTRPTPRRCRSLDDRIAGDEAVAEFYRNRSRADRPALRRRPAVGSAASPRDAAGMVWMRADGTLPDDPLLHVCVADLRLGHDAARLGAGPAGHRATARRRVHGVAGPRDVVRAAVPGRRLAALRHAVAVGLGRTRPGHRPVLHPRRRAGRQRRAGGHDPGARAAGAD